MNPPEKTPENAEALKKLRIANAKSESILKRSLSHDLFKNIISCTSTANIWTTLDWLFNKKDVARLQLLETKLANTTQGNLSIFQFFLKIKIFVQKFQLLILRSQFLRHE